MLMAIDEQSAQQAALPLECIEAEAALLGALMIENNLIDSVAAILSADDFAEPVHARVYASILFHAADGKRANPILLMPMFADDEGMKRLGGPGYLAQLTGSGAGLIGCLDFARQISDFAKRRRLRAALVEVIDRIGTSESLEQPVEQMVESIDAALNDTLQRTSTTRSMSIQVAADATLAKIDREVSGDSVPGIKLDGFNDWNRLTGNMRHGESIILGGRPGMGKTACAVSAWLAAGRAGHGALFISLEMTADELMRRALSDIAYEPGVFPNYSQIRDGRLNAWERRRLQDARNTMASWPLEITDPATLKIGRLAMIIRRYQRRLLAKGQKLDVVFLDYLGLVKPDRESGSRYADVSAISRTIKEVAKDCGVAIVSLAQLSRGVEQREDKKPQLWDLRDSGDIEQDADVVLFVYREQYYLEKNKIDPGDKRYEAYDLQCQQARDRLDLIAAKVRGGRTGERRAYFFGEYQAVRDSDHLAADRR